VVVDPEARHVLISGGAHFAAPTEAHIMGATSGGSMLNLGRIAVGLRMEILQASHRTTTSPVDVVSIGGSCHGAR
jgi:hypothetical protein